MVRVRFHLIRNAQIENVGKSQSCMVSKLRIIWKQTVARNSLDLDRHRYNTETRMSAWVGRNFRDLPLPPAMSTAERQELEAMMLTAFEKLVRFLLELLLRSVSI